MTYFINGIFDIASFHVLFVMSLAIIGGIIIGTIPGLSSVMAISLMLPIALSLGPIVGLSMLGAIYTSALYGGANSAILLNTPGTPSSLATAFDGFPMTQQGKSSQALYGALYASVLGGLFGTLILLIAFRPLAKLSLDFGPPEFFLLALLGILSVVAISNGKILKGLFSALLGLMIAMIGQDPVSGDVRFTFGIYSLVSGVNIIAALLGIFSFSQALIIIENTNTYVAPVSKEKGVIKSMFFLTISKWNLWIRSSIIGTFIGILPGAGGAIASIIAYSEARRIDKNPQNFGNGAIEGIIASEAANNAQVSGSLVPMMGLGIPGNVNAAVILGALLSFGIQPGLGLLTTSSDIAYAFIASLVVANLMMLFIGIVMIKITSKVLLIPNRYLGPLVIVLCIVGAYAGTYDIMGVWIMIAMGVLGYLMLKMDIPIGPLALGLVLGPIAEKGLTQSIQMAAVADNFLMFLIGRKISLILIIICIAALLLSIAIEIKNKKSTQTQAQL